MSGFSRKLLRESKRLADEFYKKRDKDSEREFQLRMEAFCEKIWDNWFKNGRWIVIPFTQAKTALFQIPDVLKELEPIIKDREALRKIEITLRTYAKSIGFKHDFDLDRGFESWHCDYKFKPNTSQGIWIEKEDYNEYFDSGLPNFLLFIWSNSEEKRYIHLVQNPSKYHVEEYYRKGETISYYNITKDCYEPITLDLPLMGKIPKSVLEYWAWVMRVKSLLSEGFYPDPTVQARLDEALERLKSGASSPWDEGIPLFIGEEQIERMEGSYTQVLKPLQPHKEIEKVSILGFDTEFHEDGLLSVQLALSDNEGKLKSKCILDNLEGYDAKRLLRDALDFMLECGVQPYNRIYLVAHFSVADIGHLANCLKDFKFREINRAMHAEYVVPDDSSEKEVASTELSLGDFRLKIIDLFAFYPKGLKDIGKMIGLPKIEVDRAHILDLHKGKPKKFREYAVRDAEIALKAFLNLRDFLFQNYKVELLKSPSIASVASNIFRINYLKEIPVPHTEALRYQSYRTKKGRWSKRRVKQAQYAGSLDLRKLVLLSYWGGRAECYVHGFIRGEFKLYDAMSLYPSASMLQLLPNAHTEWIDISLDNFQQSNLEGYVRVEFEFPESTRYPCLPVHGILENRLYFPLKGISFCTMSEIREAMRLGCKIKKIQGYGFIASEKEINHDLKAFMKDMLRLKVESSKESLEYETYKLIANALIGKLAQRRVEDNLDYAQQLYAIHGVPLERRFKPKGRRETVGSTWMPEWASLILGKARALMSQFISKGALMTVTDSVLLPSNVKIECDALEELRTVGSDLIAEPYEVESALIVRSKLYALLDKKGEIAKEAHHAVHLDSEQVKEIFKEALELGDDPDIEGNREHIIRLKEALQKGKPLGHTELKPSRIYFKWDWKRKLNKPLINMFKEYSDTKPLEDATEFETELFETLKHLRAKTKGRPRSYPNKLVEQVKALKQQGKSYREIAKVLGISLGKVQRILKV